MWKDWENDSASRNTLKTEDSDGGGEWEEPRAVLNDPRPCQGAAEKRQAGARPRVPLNT